MILHAVKLGHPSAPPLVFLHGFLGSHQDFLPMMTLLANNFYCIGIDLPAHGLSPRLSPLSFETTLHAILNTVNLKKAVFIGYSLGGRLALLLHHSFPSLCEEAIILSAHPGLSPEERSSYENTQQQWLTLLQEDPTSFLEAWYRQPLFHSLCHSSILKKRALIHPTLMAEVMSSLSLLHQPSLWEHLRTCHYPPFFLYGEADIKYKTLYSRLPARCSLEPIEGASHAIHLEKPSLCAEKITSFIRKKGFSL